MKALTLREPWASLIAHGFKTVETRSWRTNYRGPLAIHASSKRFGFSSGTAEFIRTWPLEVWRSVLGRADPEFCDNYPLGCVIATCELLDVLPILDPNVAPPRGEWYVNVDSDDAVRIWKPMTFDRYSGHVGESGWCPEKEEGWAQEHEAMFGDYSAGRYAWLLGDVRRIYKPKPVKGALGLWEWDGETAVLA